MNNIYNIVSQKNLQPSRQTAHLFEAPSMAQLVPGLDVVSLGSRTISQSTTLNRLMMSSAPLPVGRSLSRFEDMELGRMIQTSDRLATLSQLQSEASLASRMSLLEHSTPLGLSASISAAARKRSIELAMERELIAEEVLVQAAKRRRRDEHSWGLQQDQFVQSHKLLPEPRAYTSTLPPPAGPSVSANVLSIFSKETANTSSMLACPSCPSIPSAPFPSLSPPCSRRPSNSIVSSTPPPSSKRARAPVLLCLSCDEDNLTDYQQLARKHIQLFEAGSRDVQSATKGRNRSISLQQVGIQCSHCAHLPPGERAKGSTIYPSKMEGIYQAAQNMTNGHLAKYCKHIPEKVRRQLLSLGNRKSSAGGGRDYWTKGAKILGVVEDKHGLRFGDSLEHR